MTILRRCFLQWRLLRHTYIILQILTSSQEGETSSFIWQEHWLQSSFTVLSYKGSFLGVASLQRFIFLTHLWCLSVHPNSSLRTLIKTKKGMNKIKFDKLRVLSSLFFSVIYLSPLLSLFLTVCFSSIYFFLKNTNPPPLSFMDN